MTNSVSNIEALPGPTGSTPFNESVYAANSAFLSWGGRAKGGWVVRGTIAPNSVPSANDLTETISVPGAEVGDLCEFTAFSDHGALTVTAQVTAAGTVTVIYQNQSGSGIQPDEAAFLLRVTDLT